MNSVRQFFAVHFYANDAAIEQSLLLKRRPQIDNLLFLRHQQIKFINKYSD